MMGNLSSNVGKTILSLRLATLTCPTVTGIWKLSLVLTLTEAIPVQWYLADRSKMTSSLSVSTVVWM